MKGTQLLAVLSLAIPLAVSAQRQEALPVFDVASVKQHPESNLLGAMMRELPGSLQYRRVNLMAVIQRAYGVEAQQIVALPWMYIEAYDVEAKLPPDTPIPRLELMLQNLLAERFHLQVHREKKELAAYNLVVAKDGLKMHPSEAGRLGYRPFRDGSGRHLRGKITLPVLANNLSGVLGHPVVDQTGIDGLYDIDLNYADDARDQEPSNYPGIARALQEQLGLKLESKKALFDMIIVDHAEKVPTEN
jgi:uncharacterized protein (TIGR03435 family)